MMERAKYSIKTLNEKLRNKLLSTSALGHLDPEYILIYPDLVSFWITERSAKYEDSLI